MSSCYLIDLFVLMTSDDLGSCRVKRLNRPCLVCDGMMDLVEVTQSVNLYFLPACFNSKTMCFLDCQNCGFSSTLDSYRYLNLCQEDGEMPVSTKTPIDGEQSVSCGNCKCKLAQGWQYCPTCGTKFDRPVQAAKTIKFKADVEELTRSDSDSSLEDLKPSFPNADYSTTAATT